MDCTVPTDSSADSTVPLEYLYLSAGLFESSVRYSAKAKYRPNEVPLGDFNLKIKHKNVDKMSCNHSAGILKGFFLSKEPKKGYLNLVRQSL